MTLRRQAALTTVAAVGVALASLLPWVGTGNIGRSGYSLASALHHAGLGDIHIVRALFVAWFLLPLLAAATWTLAAAGKYVVAASFSLLVAVAGLGTGISVLASHVDTKAGPPVSIALSLLTLAGGIGVLHLGRRAT
ncbi:MAG: hypothetical protein ABR548_04760 [Actinomycetota bacterium]|nr:hypothetical protein [Actinomycetota bacterium]